VESSATRPAITDVLLADFSDPVRTSTAEILRLEGLTVTEADDGEIVLELLREHKFRLVLLELDLPKRNGIEILEAISDPPPVVIISSYRMKPRDYERFMPDKVMAHFTKPVKPRELLDTVLALLR